MVAQRLLFGFEHEAGTPTGIKRYSKQLGDALMRVASPEQFFVRVEPKRGLIPVLTRAWEHGFVPPKTLNFDASAPAVHTLPKNGNDHELATSSIHSVSLFAPITSTLRTVVTVHDLVAFTHPHYLTKRGAVWHQKMIQRAVEYASALVVPTTAVKEQLVARFSAEVLADRVHVVGGAASLPMPDSNEWFGKPDSPYIVCVGVIEPRKRIDAIIGAVAQLDDLTLVVVGSDGWGDIDVNALAARIGLEPERLLHVRKASDQLLSNIIGEADAVVMASEAEGFGLPVVEAMALGTPVVHSDDAALCEVSGGAAVIAQFHSDVNVYVRNLAEAIERARDSADELRLSGKVRAEKYDWDVSANQVWQLHATLE